MTDFTGRWNTSFGPMTLAQTGDEVTGTYGRSEPRSTLRGTVCNRRLMFDYAETREHGTGWFDLARDGRFVGEYLANGTGSPRPWQGNRGFDGIWSTSLGTMRLVQDSDRVLGFLDHGAPFDGRLANGKLTFSNFIPDTKGEATFELAADDNELRGHWKGENDGGTIEIDGVRLMPDARTTWLIVLEAHWQRSLAEREFAFGDMLDEIFARLPNVNVRHRYFDDEESLLHWCAALQFLPEPVVLVVTSHGEPEGITVRGKIIDSAKIIATLQLADSLRLVHFSSCLIAKNGGSSLANPSFPVSGYTSSVDWMASALTEFTYLDMILSKRLTPEAAAAQVYRLIGFAGDEVPPDCPYPAAGFQLIARTSLDGADGPPGQAPTVLVASAESFPREIGRSLLDKLDSLRRKLTDRG